jgi:hypothetical protein
MASSAQLSANRENAQLSTGPRTIEGKQASSRNSSRHGLTGTQIVMPGEDAAAYEELRSGMHFAHNPANDPERVLVDQIAANAWRLMRAQRVETAFLAKLAEGSENPDATIAAAFVERPKDLARMQRYVSAATNAYYKAMSELAKLQKARAAAEQDAAESEQFMADRLPIGFVSQIVRTARSRRPGSLESAAAGSHKH